VAGSPGSWDIAIVGGGIHGASAAYHLARHANKIILLERSYPADGPTGRSTAICRAYYTNGFLAEIAAKSLDFLANFRARTSGDAGFRRCGAVYLHGPEDEAQVTRTVARIGGGRTGPQLVDVTSVRHKVPGMELDGAGAAVWEAGAGYADPVATTKGLLEDAVRRGVETRLQTKVAQLTMRRGSWSLGLADGSEITAARVLVAAGPWTRTLLQTAGVDLPLRVERHVVATVEPAVGRELPCVVVDVLAGIYLKPELRSVCIGGLWPASETGADGPIAPISDAEGERLLAPSVARLPWLAAAAYTGGWASLYDVSPDWQPVIGEVADGLVVDAGTSGHGFKLAPALGYHVARLVLGEPADPRLAQFHPGRFARGALLEAGFGDARILA
jgi:glycine/D-amino acid oxidase-like deaminating enzyme